MAQPTKRRRGLLVATAMIAGATGIVVGTVAPAAQAVTTIPPNTCKGLTGSISDLPIPINVDAPASITLGDTVTLTGITVTVAVTPALVEAGIGAQVVNFVTDPGQLANSAAGGKNTVNLATGKATLQINGSNTVQGTQTTSNPDPLAFEFWAVQDLLGVVTVYVSNGSGGYVNVPAIPIAVPMSDLTFTGDADGGNISFTEPLVIPTSSNGVATPVPADLPNAPLRLLPTLAGLTVPFNCWLGTDFADPTTTPPTPATTSFTPASSAFELASTTVIAPPTPPSCTGATPSVAAGQSITIDFTQRCIDVNGNSTIQWNSIGFGWGDPANPTTCVPAQVLAATGSAVCNLPSGTLTGQAGPAGLTGVFTYQNTVTNASTELFGFTVGDNTCTLGGVFNPLTQSCTPTPPETTSAQRRSAPALINLSILQGTCTVQSTSCDVTQIVQVVVTPGNELKMSASSSNTVVLSGITLNGQYQLSTGSLNDMTVLNTRGTAAGWSIVGQASDFKTATYTGPGCSGASGVANRLCVPATNLSWVPTAVITHTVIPGDVAAITPGSAGSSALPISGGLGGGGSASSTLCSSPVNQSGGTFKCDAALTLAIPASAGAGTYEGTIVLTLS